MPKYLISAEKEYYARDIANSLGLKPNEWTYIPSRDESRRMQILRGREALPEFLIGTFSPEERFYLYGRKRNMPIPNKSLTDLSDELLAQIEERKKLQAQMVGNLYPAILQDEILKLEAARSCLKHGRPPTGSGARY